MTPSDSIEHPIGEIAAGGSEAARQAARAVPTPALPPDPQAYDSERSAAARRRGLSTPYIPGGLDPDPERAEREERRDLRILVALVIAVVLAGFVLGVVAALLGFDVLAGRSG